MQNEENFEDEDISENKTDDLKKKALNIVEKDKFK